jgi:hypothetical protein
MTGCRGENHLPIQNNLSPSRKNISVPENTGVNLPTRKVSCGFPGSTFFGDFFVGLPRLAWMTV